MTDAERALLFAMRSTIDALLLGHGSEPQPPTCPHDEREPSPESTLGHPVWRCARCKAPVDP